MHEQSTFRFTTTTLGRRILPTIFNFHFVLQIPICPTNINATDIYAKPLPNLEKHLIAFEVCSSSLGSMRGCYHTKVYSSCQWSLSFSLWFFPRYLSLREWGERGIGPLGRRPIQERTTKFIPSMPSPTRSLQPPSYVSHLREHLAAGNKFCFEIKLSWHFLATCLFPWKGARGKRLKPSWCIIHASLKAKTKASLKDKAQFF